MQTVVLSSNSTTISSPRPPQTSEHSVLVSKDSDSLDQASTESSKTSWPRVAISPKEMALEVSRSTERSSLMKTSKPSTTRNTSSRWPMQVLTPTAPSSSSPSCHAPGLMASMSYSVRWSRDLGLLMLFTKTLLLKMEYPALQ